MQATSCSRIDGVTTRALPCPSNSRIPFAGDRVFNDFVSTYAKADPQKAIKAGHQRMQGQRDGQADDGLDARAGPVALHQAIGRSLRIVAATSGATDDGGNGDTLLTLISHST